MPRWNVKKMRFFRYSLSCMETLVRWIVGELMANVFVGDLGDCERIAASLRGHPETLTRLRGCVALNGTGVEANGRDRLAYGIAGQMSER